MVHAETAVPARAFLFTRSRVARLDRYAKDSSMASAALEAKAGAKRSHEVIVIGGGQAGLATGYQLARRGVPFLILEAYDRIGDSWRMRWD